MKNQITNYGLTFALKSLLRFYPIPEPRVFRGAGSIQELARHVATDSLESVLLITSKYFVAEKKIDPIIEVFRNKDIHVEIFSDVPPNPSLDVVERGAELCRSKNCGAIYAFGGGSVIDAAKGIAAQVGSNAPARKLIGLFKVKGKALPLFVVPTTSGSGSEVTNAAVLSDPETHQKLFLFDHKIVPLAIALDPNATLTLPPKFTAATGMDALTHAIESYISKISDKRSEELAESAISTIFEYLPKAYNEGQDLHAREKMAVASYEAGIAFSRSGLGFVHAISHQITAFYGIPHGAANAVILPYVLRASISKAAPALAKLARTVGILDEGKRDEDLADLFIEKVRTLSMQLELPAAFPEMDEKDFETIAGNAVKEASFNFPVPKMLHPEDCIEILRMLKAGEFSEEDSASIEFPPVEKDSRSSKNVAVA